jgi:hypothetical protein
MMVQPRLVGGSGQQLHELQEGLVRVGVAGEVIDQPSLGLGLELACSLIWDSFFPSPRWSSLWCWRFTLSGAIFETEIMKNGYGALRNLRVFVHRQDVLVRCDGRALSLYAVDRSLFAQCCRPPLATLIRHAPFAHILYAAKKNPPAHMWHSLIQIAVAMFAILLSPPISETAFTIISSCIQASR